MKVSYSPNMTGMDVLVRDLPSAAVFQFSDGLYFRIKDGKYDGYVSLNYGFYFDLNTCDPERTLVCKRVDGEFLCKSFA